MLNKKQKGMVFIMNTDMFGFLNEVPVDEIQLSPADESAIFLAALEDMCTPEEFKDLVLNHATEMELYGLIDDASIVTEAKKIIYKQTKQMAMNREQAKACLRLAAKANSPDWVKYHKGRTMMLQARENIYKKYGNVAKKEARRIVSDANRKASSMKSEVGGTVTDKMARKINQVNKGGKIGAGAV